MGGVEGNRDENIQGYSSVGRVPVSKTVGRGFEPFCPCQKQNRHRLSVSVLFFVEISGEEPLRCLHLKTFALDFLSQTATGGANRGSEPFCPCQKIRCESIGFFYPSRRPKPRLGISSPHNVRCISSAPYGAVSHHALACIFLRLDDIQHFVLMIYNASH